MADETVDAAKLWYTYPICVPFNNPAYDPGYGGSHDMDLATPPNTPITALRAGRVASIGSPSWGKAVGIFLDTPRNGIPYMAYLHLSAVRPGLAVGGRVEVGQLVGWSGGCTSEEQYAGTSNPTGENFLNDPSQSSQPQTGLAMMRGPVYGSGAGWTPRPDPALDPSWLLHNIPNTNVDQERYFEDFWNSNANMLASILQKIATVPPVRIHTGIFNAWVDLLKNGHYIGGPTTPEYDSVSADGQRIICQNFGSYRAEWNPQAGQLIGFFGPAGKM